MSEPSDTPPRPPTSHSAQSNAPQSNASPAGRVAARWTMPDAAPPLSLSPEQSAQAELRARRGLVLIGVGVVGVLWGVFHVLAALPTAKSLDFAHRMTDYQARSSMHENFPGGLVRALIGLGIALWGGRMRAAALRTLGRGGE